MAAYKGEYLLRNPFLASRNPEVRQAEAGVKGASDSLAAQRDLYQKALAAGAGTRSSFLESQRQPFEQFRSERAAEQEVQTYAQANAMQRAGDLASQESRFMGGIKGKQKKAKKDLVRSDKWQKDIPGIQRKLGAVQAASPYAQGLVSEFASRARAQDVLTANRANPMNRFFGGNEFATTAGGRGPEAFAEEARMNYTLGMGPNPMRAEDYNRRWARTVRRDPTGAASALANKRAVTEAFAFGGQTMGRPGREAMLGQGYRFLQRKAGDPTAKHAFARNAMGFGTPLDLAMTTGDVIQRGTAFARNQLTGGSPLQQRSLSRWGY